MDHTVWNDRIVINDELERTQQKHHRLVLPAVLLLLMTNSHSEYSTCQSTGSIVVHATFFLAACPTGSKLPQLFSPPQSATSWCLLLDHLL